MMFSTACRSRRSTSVAVFAVVLCVLGSLSGCVRRNYDIQLEVTDAGLERTTKISGSSAPKEGELAGVAKAYAINGPKNVENGIQFGGKAFDGDMPFDVGGAGHFARYESPLGSVYGYVERFRGNDDLYSQHQAREKAVDEFANQIVGWFETELGKEAGWPALREFLDRTLRLDLQNLSLYLSPLHSMRKEDQFGSSTLAQMGLSAGQYLAERRYMTYEELPAFARACLPQNADAGKVFLVNRLRDAVLAKARDAQPPIAAGKLDFLSSPERLQESWQKYFEQTEYFQREYPKLVAREEKKLIEARQSKDTSPDTLATAEQNFEKRREELRRTVIAYLAMQAFVPWFDLRSYDRVNVSLTVANEPVWTNGKWDAEKKRVTWQEDVDAPEEDKPPRPLDIPAFCFAIWDAPNDAEQQRHFSSTVVRGKDLVEYCIWYQALTLDERKQWDEFLSTLKSDVESQRRLKQFTFAGEVNPSLSQSAPGRRAILRALKLGDD